MNRRNFLFAAGTAALASSGRVIAAESETRPVRDKPLRAGFWGPEFYDEKELAEIQDVHRRGAPFRWYGPGSQPPMKVATFEKEFAARMQTRFAVAVSSGTAALECALAALGIGPGDEVILSAWTWHSCFNAIVMLGALPVFAEIDESFNIDPGDLETKITPQTKVILAAHLQGNPCALDRIMDIAARRRLKVLEDCAQSVGASYKGKPLGSIGHIGIYSLQLNKTITAGEGGAVATSDPALFERVARFHDLGILRPFHQEWLGQPSPEGFIAPHCRMDEFRGGVLLAQLRKLDTIVEAVRSRARQVYQGIAGLPELHLRLLPDPSGELGSAVFLGFKSKEIRDRYLTEMSRQNVPASPPGGSAILPIFPHIEKKLTVHPAWPSFQTERGKSIRYGSGCCPKTIDILNRFAGVSLDPKYTPQDVQDIIAAIRKVYPGVTKSL
jgi:8-amino-3,8-dideoxy-alpha-D-manno-octulosonate transaminase